MELEMDEEPVIDFKDRVEVEGDSTGDVLIRWTRLRRSDGGNMRSLVEADDEYPKGKGRGNEELFLLGSSRTLSRAVDVAPTRLISDLMIRPARTASEKLTVLEERDKLMRAEADREKSSTGRPSRLGVCPDMCPERERIMREVRGIVSAHEALPDSANELDHSRAVKEYARSSADQEEPLPHDLRPAPVLRMTMNYLIVEIMRRLDQHHGENRGNWYDFCWGRLRAIRKDIIQQQLCDMNTVNIVEECARFHICCFDRLWDSSKSVFDDKINSETLMNCLKSLTYMYEDLRKQGIACPNEAEFRGYMFLLKLHSGFVLSEFQQFPRDLRRSPKVREAVAIHTAYSNNMYSTFFSLVCKTTYLNACLMQRFFGHLRTRALEIVVKSHCPPNKTINISVSYIAQTLKFDSHGDCIAFCSDFGLTVTEDRMSFNVSRNDFYFPEAMITEGSSSSLVVKKRTSVAESVLGHSQLPIISPHQVHSSFSDDHVLTPEALNAQDQQRKAVAPYVSTVGTSRPDAVGLTSTDVVEATELEEVRFLQPSPKSVTDGSSDTSGELPNTCDGDEEEEKLVDNEKEFCDEVLSTSDHISEQLTLSDEDSVDDNSPAGGGFTYWPSVEPPTPSSPIFLSSAIAISPKIDTPTVPVSPICQLQSVQETPELEKSSFDFSCAMGDYMARKEALLIIPTNISVGDRPVTYKAIQNSMVDRDNNLLMAKLRQKLNEKMKRISANKYARIWRAKVLKAKARKAKELNCVVRHITVDEYLNLWGTRRAPMSVLQTCDRLSKRKRANLLVTALLNLNIVDKFDTQVRDVGARVAEILGRSSIVWAHQFGNIAQPRPVLWKLVVSLPLLLSKGKGIRDNLHRWLQAAFDMEDKTDEGGCWESSWGVPVFIHPVIVEGLKEIPSKGRFLSAALFISAPEWEAPQVTRGRMAALGLLSSSTSPIPTAVLTLGNLSVEHILSRPPELLVLEERSWESADTLVASLALLATHYHMDNLKVQSLGLLVETTGEKYFDALLQDRHLNVRLAEQLNHPNFAIALYNRLIEKLEAEILCCHAVSYHELASEMEPLAKKMKRPDTAFPSSGGSFKVELSEWVRRLKLSQLPERYTDSLEFVANLRDYLQYQNCSSLFSSIVRIINPPDRDDKVGLDDYLSSIEWLPIIEMITKRMINRQLYQFKILYREDRVRELACGHWWLENK